ncbi:CPBP family glutamic-type intramembrane protease [Streptococcus agalactiae]|uniref:CPBP family glutamic-type intramembrane protease n=1 Tax=Streptococcus agalactiae TaxID=1311 RepID=UPI0021DFD5CF|nr:CPBP family glutamic-type intramembrane protease [Streptococcus agalactiae]
MILSSILFSWSHLHGLSVVDFVVYFGMGLIFASLLHYTKSIHYSIGEHIIWNSLLYIFYFLAFLLDLL